MAGNTIGKLFKLTTFGESHGEAIGGVIDGCPAGLKINKDFIQLELTRRKTGPSFFSSNREEKDEVNFISGLFDGQTTGAPLAFVIKNINAKSDDYETIKEIYRPSHADYTYDKKYSIRDYRGGGRASARETVARVVAGAIAKQVLEQSQIKIIAYVSQIGSIKLQKTYKELDFKTIESNFVRCPDADTAQQMLDYIEIVKNNNDSVGGVITCVVSLCPIGLGEPIFDKLQADLAKAMLSIPSVKGFDYGSGFDAASMLGSENNDIFVIDNNQQITTKTNHSGGIQGGISNGEDIYFRVAFKPIASIMKEQQTIDRNKNQVTLKIKGRHDVCAIPRAVPIVEAMAAIVFTDHFLRNKAYLFDKK